MFEILDFRTIIFMASLLAFALSFLLIGVKLVSTNINGIGNWAAAVALVGIALLTFIQLQISLHWRIVIGSFFMTLGLGLYYHGILAFDRVDVKKRQIALAYLSFFITNGFIAAFLNDEYTLILLNTTVCIALSLLSAKALLIDRKQYRNEVGYRLTGYTFLLFVVLTLYRLSTIVDQKYHTLDRLTAWPLNELTFIGCIFCVSVITFGCVLMVYERLANQLSFAAGHDWLTGVMNRGNLQRAAARLQASSVRENKNYSMLLMDLDFFKKVNDQYGHLIGDEVLKKFTKVIDNCKRESDIVGRYGGEEFCVLLPKSNESEAMLLAERIRITFEQQVIVLHGKQIKSTVSIGVADAKMANPSFEKMFGAADTALYEAKKNGRNQTVCFSALKLNSTLILEPSMFD